MYWEFFCINIILSALVLSDNEDCQTYVTKNYQLILSIADKYQWTHTAGLKRSFIPTDIY